jgi:hypothetical protein
VQRVASANAAGNRVYTFDVLREEYRALPAYEKPRV